MIRPATLLLLAAGLALAAPPGFAQTVDAPQTHRKTAKPAKPRKAAVQAPTTAAPVAGGINAPSTDFSKIERAGEESDGPDAPAFRPSMGAGGMGLGGSF